MIHYIHHVPGRLRAKIPAVKGSAANAHRVKAHLGYIEGVHAIEANTLTGSVTLRYDATRITGDALLAELRGLQLVPEVAPSTELFVHRGGAGADAIANKVAGKIFETVLERSAIALIGALI
jgi:hypothetical protein